MIASAKRNGLILALFALLSTSLLAGIHALTADRIARQEQEQLIRILHQLFPQDSYNNDIFGSCVLVEDHQYLGREALIPMYIARQDGEKVAVAIEATAPDGYNGSIHLIVGIWQDGSVAGVRVLSHTETPGLGDKIELAKSDWVLDFNHKRLSGEKDPNWHVRKDGGQFDTFTGATITPRAVVKAVKRVLLYAEANRAAIGDGNFPACRGSA